MRVELSVPLCIRPSPMGLHPFHPLKFHNAAAACTGEASLLRPSFTIKDKHSFIFKYYIDIEAHVCAFNNINMVECETSWSSGSLLLSQWLHFPECRWQHLRFVISFRGYFRANKDCASS
ncbi:hypothetical protein CEXT_651081 [Caerostris extrusa]|uniref:Uncharacterized protein n=1 Tax=Caerostris extrusa TaxID=172846 RepID=A0AAV4T659_CAEEX|nr:hypothetical protein CEXT_651081 [Caerostris extrusa]